MMKSKNAFLLLLSLVILAISCIGVSADVTPGLTETNRTEFNSLTPALTINCTGGNDTHYNATIYFNDSIVYGPTMIANNTATEATVSAQTGGTSVAAILGCVSFNVTGEDAANSSQSVFEINMNPTLTSISDGDRIITKGNSVTFTGAVTDTNSTGADGVTLFVCLTDSFTTTCAAGQELCNGTGTTAPSCSYTVPRTHTTGLVPYYSFVIDNNNWANTTSVDGNFKIGGYIIEDEETTTTGGGTIPTTAVPTAAPAEGKFLSVMTSEKAYVGPVHIAIPIVILLLVLGYVYVTKIKKN